MIETKRGLSRGGSIAALLLGALAACSSGERDETGGNQPTASGGATYGTGGFGAPSGTGGFLSPPLGSGGAAGNPVVGTGGDPAGVGGTFGGAPGVGGTGLVPAGDGGTLGDGGSVGDGGMAATGGDVGMGGTDPVGTGGTTTVPPATDYAANGPYPPRTVNNTGPNGQYTIVRPTTLGENGFLHPVATWGNGILTNPALYPGLLNAIASHGFVVIASNSSNVTAALMTQGLDWMLAQNAAAGDYQGKLDTERAVTIGYSLGGGAAVGSGNHPKVVTTVSFYGLQGPAENLSGPLLLLTSTADGFVTKQGYVQPTYNRSSRVPTVLATLSVNAPADFAGHLLPLGDAGPLREPAIAWLRYWVYGDQNARRYFYGADCVLCQSPWVDIQRKNADWN